MKTSRQHPGDIPATCFKQRWLWGGKMKCANAGKDTLLSMLQARGHLLSTGFPWPIMPWRSNHLNLPFARPEVLSLPPEGMFHHSTEHLSYTAPAWTNLFWIANQNPEYFIWWACFHTLHSWTISPLEWRKYLFHCKISCCPLHSRLEWSPLWMN